MGRESKKGDAFYKDQGLTPVKVFIPESDKIKLERIAKKRDLTVQKLLARMIRRFLGNA